MNHNTSTTTRPAAVHEPRDLTPDPRELPSPRQVPSPRDLPSPRETHEPRELPGPREVPGRRETHAPRELPGPREVPGSPVVTQGALALQLEPVELVAPDPPETAVPTERPLLRLVRNEPQDDETHQWATRLVHAIAEVLVGDRPISQLVRFTDSEVYMDLNRRVRLLGLTTTATTRGALPRDAVRSVHVASPAPRVAEVCAHLRTGPRSRALALRLELRRNRWICTALEVG